MMNDPARKAILDEIHDLLDCVNADGQLADFDQFDRDSLSVLGQAVYDLLDSRSDLLEACEDMCGLIEESSGVVGYHLNGDNAVWAEFDVVNRMAAAIAKAKGKP